MSEAIRSYRPPRRSGYDAPISGRGTTRWIVAAAVFLCLVWLLWTTRDNWPMERLVPRDQTFQLRAQHLLTTREKAANSAFWNLGLLPEEYRDIPRWLGSDFGLPQWVLNNLVSDVCYVSGTDLDKFTDLLVVTRMSRIGCLLERYYGIADDIEVEYAGGLELRRMGTLGAYYAVRGRTLVFSPSRDALIRALTLHEDDAVEQLEGTVAPMAGDVQGRIAFGESEPLGKYLTQSDFGLRFDPGAITFSSRSSVTPAWKAQLDTLAGRGASGRLMIPAQGSLVFAGDFDTPLPAVWTSVEEMTGGALSEFLKKLPALAPPVEGGASWSALLEGLKASLGSSFSLRWTGFDLNGVVPLPEAELFVETRPDSAQQALDLIPALPAGQSPLDFTPYLVPESRIVRCPVGWGGILEPALHPEERGLRIALHPQHLEHALLMDHATEPAPGEGQLFLRIRPGELLDLLREGGARYAESGLLKGHNRDSFEAAMAQALAGSRQISEMRFSAAYVDGAIMLEAVVLLTGEDAPAGEELTQEVPRTATE